MEREREGKKGRKKERPNRTARGRGEIREID